MNKTTKLSEASIQFGLLSKIAVLKGRVGIERSTDTPMFLKDSQGREICNRGEYMKDRRNDEREAATQLHGNNPETRLNLCGFPILDREFMLSYDYKASVDGLNFSAWDWQFLMGPPGTGKTTLACRQAWEWMKKDPTRKVTFLSIVDWIRDLQRFIKNDDSEYEELPKFHPFVILDDFDKIQSTNWQILQIFRLIDFLYRSDRRVIITSNKTFEQIINSADQNGNMKTAIDRIRGRSKGGIVAMNGKSYRYP